MLVEVLERVDDGRRRFGSVSAAILTVMALHEGEMAVKEIRARVERILGGRVSRHSVMDYLIKYSKGASPLFQRTRRGHYRLLR